MTYTSKPQRLLIGVNRRKEADGLRFTALCFCLEVARHRAAGGYADSLATEAILCLRDANACEEPGSWQ